MSGHFGLIRLGTKKSSLFGQGETKKAVSTRGYRLPAATSPKKDAPYASPRDLERIVQKEVELPGKYLHVMND